MKNIIYMALIAGTLTVWAQNLTVKEADITGKTNLVGVIDTTLKGNAVTILTDGQGLSLYTFTLDSKDHSNCTGKCLNEWPPQHVPAGVQVQAPFGVIQGNDGQSQLTLEGMPLYHYDDDKKPGDTQGQYPKWDAVIITK